MKYRRTIRCMAICLFFAAEAKAQQLTPSTPATFSQPVLFKKLPQKTICDIPSLEKLFAATDSVTFQLSPACLLEGKIISHVKPNLFAETLNISLAAFDGAVFTLSRIETGDGNTRYRGHIMSLQSSDAIVMQQENGNYYFIKTEQKLLMTE